MIRKEDLLASMIHDCEVCKHLHSKIPPGGLDYRPTPGQRSTAELLQYLSICGIGGATCMAHDNWKLYGEFSERAQALESDGFPAAMDLQISELRSLFDSLSESDLETKQAPMPGGGTQPLGVGLLNAPAKWLSAYRMQLFLYVKAAGVSEIGTVNAWLGMDAPTAEAGTT